MMSENLQEGRDFLTKKEGEDGVVALPSGLLYKVIEAGDGATPNASDSVTVHYRGTLIDGTVFDSSYDRGQPATFPVNRVIAGWVEALQLMTEGSKWELYIPSEMAYGRGGAGADIGPDCALIFEVELINIA
jgi:FKBP-type peptidyl-prolyl cis-trans isomerase FklB